MHRSKINVNRTSKHLLELLSCQCLSYVSDFCVVVRFIWEFLLYSLVRIWVKLFHFVFLSIGFVIHQRFRHEQSVLSLRKLHMGAVQSRIHHSDLKLLIFWGIHTFFSIVI